MHFKNNLIYIAFAALVICYSMVLANTGHRDGLDSSYSSRVSDPNTGERYNMVLELGSSYSSNSSINVLENSDSSYSNGNNRYNWDHILDSHYPYNNSMNRLENERSLPQRGRTLHRGQQMPISIYGRGNSGIKSTYSLNLPNSKNVLFYGSEDAFVEDREECVIVGPTNRLNQTAFKMFYPQSIMHGFSKSELNFAMFFLGLEVDHVDAARFLFKYCPRLTAQNVDFACLDPTKWIQLLDLKHRYYLPLWAREWRKIKRNNNVLNFNLWLTGRDKHNRPPARLQINSAGRKFDHSNEVGVGRLNAESTQFIEAENLERINRLKLHVEGDPAYDLLSFRKGRPLKRKVNSLKRILPDVDLNQEKFYKNLREFLAFKKKNKEKGNLGLSDYDQPASKRTEDEKALLFFWSRSDRPISNNDYIRYACSQAYALRGRSKERKLLYVLTLEMKMYVTHFKEESMSHLSLTQGLPVISAGYIALNDGKITYIDNKSEDYQTPISAFRTMLLYFAAANIDISSTEIKEFNPTSLNSREYY